MTIIRMRWIGITPAWDWIRVMPPEEKSNKVISIKLKRISLAVNSRQQSQEKSVPIIGQWRSKEIN